MKNKESVCYHCGKKIDKKFDFVDAEIDIEGRFIYCNLCRCCMIKLVQQIKTYCDPILQYEMGCKEL